MDDFSETWETVFGEPYDPYAAPESAANEDMSQSSFDAAEDGSYFLAAAAPQQQSWLNTPEFPALPPTPPDQGEYTQAPMTRVPMSRVFRSDVFLTEPYYPSPPTSESILGGSPPFPHDGAFNPWQDPINPYAGTFMPPSQQFGMPGGVPAPSFLPQPQLQPQPEVQPAPAKRKRGRPKGVKDKVKRSSKGPAPHRLPTYSRSGRPTNAQRDAAMRYRALAAEQVQRMAAGGHVTDAEREELERLAAEGRVSAKRMS